VVGGAKGRAQLKLAISSIWGLRNVNIEKGKRERSILGKMVVERNHGPRPHEQWETEIY